MLQKRKSILEPVAVLLWISKAVMDRTRLRNKFLKYRSAENKRAYNRQKNYSVSLTRKSKRDYYNDLDNKNVTDNKLFWKTVKLFFSDKGPMKQKITLIENEEIIGNIFFLSIVAKLNIPKYKDWSVNSVNSGDPLGNLVTKQESSKHNSNSWQISKYVIFVENSFQEGYRKGNFKPQCSKGISRLRYASKNN